MTSPAAAPQFLAERLELMFRQSRAVFAGNIFVAALSVYVLWDQTGRGTLLAWAGAVFALTAARIALVAAHRRLRPAPARAPRWAWGFALSALLSGLLWGAITPLFFDPAQPLTVVYVGIVLAGMTGGSVASLSAFPPAYWAFATPAVLPFAARSFAEGGEVYTAFGLLALFLLGVNLAYSRAIHRTISDSIRLRAENVDLIDRLREEKDRAEAASRSKSKFLAAASHDLRQPAHALALLVSALQRLTDRSASVSRTQIRSVTGHMQASLGALASLLSTLLDISKLDAGVTKPVVRDFPLQELFARLQSQFGASAAEKSLRLRFRPSRYWCKSDGDVLERILANLVSNALRYTRRGGVLVGARRRGAALEICVYDTGIGIAPEHREAVFDEFFQVDNSARDREKGLGLGLAIARRSAQLLGHALALASAPGRGSCFSVRVPLAPKGSIQAAPPARPRARPAAEDTVVVIDDDREALTAVSYLLSVEGFRVINGPDVASVAPAVTRAAPNVRAVVADYRLANGVTGDQAIAEVRSRLRRAVPGLLVTGDTSPDRIVGAARSGHRLLHKPVAAEVLLQALHELLDSARAPVN